MKINPKMNEDVTFFLVGVFLLVKIRLICIFHLTAKALRMELPTGWMGTGGGWPMDHRCILITGLDFSILWFYGLVMDE